MANPETVTPPTSRGALKKDDNGVAVGWTHAHITAAAPTTTAVKAGPGVLHTINLNTPVATGVITVYDSLSAAGTVIAVYTTAEGQSPSSVLYDVAFTIGLTITTATAAQDITVSYI